MHVHVGLALLWFQLLFTFSGVTNNLSGRLMKSIAKDMYMYAIIMSFNPTYMHGYTWIHDCIKNMHTSIM